MDRRTEVVSKSGQRDLGGARAAADRRVGFDDMHREPALRERHCGGQAVRTGADDDDVVVQVALLLRRIIA